MNIYISNIFNYLKRQRIPILMRINLLEKQNGATNLCRYKVMCWRNSRRIGSNDLSNHNDFLSFVSCDFVRIAISYILIQPHVFQQNTDLMHEGGGVQLGDDINSLFAYRNDTLFTVLLKQYCCFTVSAVTNKAFFANIPLKTWYFLM